MTHFPCVQLLLLLVVAFKIEGLLDFHEGMWDPAFGRWNLSLVVSGCRSGTPVTPHSYSFSCATSVAPNAGQNKACRSNVPHVAFRAARGETQKMRISLPSHKTEGFEEVCCTKTPKTRKLWKMQMTKPRKMWMIGLTMAGLRCSPRLA